MRPKPLPAQPRIQARESPGRLVRPPCALLDTVLPAFFQLQQQIIDVLLPCLNQPLWFTQDPARHEVLQGRVRMPQSMLYHGLHAGQERLEWLPQLLFTLHHQFSRHRGSWRTQVSDKIGDGVIDFMPHGGNDRDLRGGNGAHDLFFIKGPEIFQRTAPTSNDQHIQLRTPGI